MKAALPEARQALELIRSRRTRKPQEFTGERIPDETVMQLLEAANWAPTHGYTEPWRFRIFADAGLKRLGLFLAEQDQPETQDENFNPQRFEKLQNRPRAASHVIGIGLQPGHNPKVPEIEEISAVAMAVQNLWLLAHASGYGGYWSSGQMAYTDATRRFLELPEGARSLGFFYLGCPSEPPKEGRRLSPIEQKITWNHQ